MESKLNKRLFIFILILLVFPLVQYMYPIIRIAKLKGAIKEPKEVVLSFENWNNGVFQELSEEYIKAKNGLRTFWVRVYNQWNYSVNNIINPKFIVKGTNDYLYTTGYIESYLGEDYLGDAKIDSIVRDLSLIRDTLLTKGCELLIAFAPSKVWCLPENVPSKYDLSKKKISNYEYYLESVKRSTIPHIDFNKWFINMKDTSQYSLYPKGGIHWSIYGGLKAADSISQFMASTSQVAPIDYHVESIELTDDCKYTDADICEAMNLYYWDGQHDLMAYPIIDFQNHTDLPKPKVISISDSFYWTFMNTKVHENAFAEGSQFWYYYKTIYGNGEKIGIETVDLRTAFDDKDFVLLLATEETLDRFPYGFIKAMKQEYKIE